MTASMRRLTIGPPRTLQDSMSGSGSMNQSIDVPSARVGFPIGYSSTSRPASTKIDRGPPRVGRLPVSDRHASHSGSTEPRPGRTTSGRAARVRLDHLVGARNRFSIDEPWRGAPTRARWPAALVLRVSLGRSTRQTWGPPITPNVKSRRSHRRPHRRSGGNSARVEGRIE